MGSTAVLNYISLESGQFQFSLSGETWGTNGPIVKIVLLLINPKLGALTANLLLGYCAALPEPEN